jgi:hypothetical protein
LYSSSLIPGGRPGRCQLPPRDRGQPPGELFVETLPSALVRSGGDIDSGGGRLVAPRPNNSSRDRITGGLVRSKSWVTLAPRSTRFINVTVCSSQRSEGPATFFASKSASVPAEATTSPVAFSTAMPVNCPGWTRSVSADSNRSFETTPPKRRCERNTMPRVVEMSFAR